MASWIVVGVFTLLGISLGLFGATLVPVQYTAQGQMIVGATSVNAAAIPSFTEAGQALAQTYSRVYVGDAVQDALKKSGLAAPGITSSASPIPDSSVVMIEATAKSPTLALRTVNTGIGALNSTVDALLDNSESVNRAKTALQNANQTLAEQQAELARIESKTGTAAIAAKARIATTQTQVDAAEALLTSQVGNSVQANGIQPLTTASVTSTTLSTRLQFGAFAGAIVSFGLSWLLLIRRSQVRRNQASL